MTDDFRYHGARSPFLGPFVSGAVEGCGYTPSSPNCSNAEDLCIATACQASQVEPAGTITAYLTTAQQATFDSDFSTYMAANNVNSPWKAFELWVTAIYEADPIVLSALSYYELAWIWNEVQESVAYNTTSPWRVSACVNKMLNQWFSMASIPGSINIGQSIYWYDGSNVWSEPYGGGTITNVSSQFPAQSDHGTVAPPCCYPDGLPLCGSDSDCCQGSACVSGTCIGCGLTGEPCCAGACNSGLDVCANNQCVPCGGANEPCCSGGTCGAGSGLTCQNGTCQSPPAACGGNQQPCCLNSSCDPGYQCVASSCQPCGQIGEYCCDGACASGLACTNGQCAQPPIECGNAAGEPCCSGNVCAQGLACDTSTGLCQTACGDNGEICCHGGTCNGGLSCVNNICECGYEGTACCTSGIACSADLICQNGTCVGCGQQNEPCCNGNTPCGTDLVCKNGTCQCGYYAGPCCSDGSCGTGMVCSQGTCVYCGASGEQCCPGGTCAGSMTCQNGTCNTPPSTSTCNDNGACSTWCASGIGINDCECVCCCYFTQYGAVPQSITDLNDYGRATGMQNADGTWTCPSGSGGCGASVGGTPTGTIDYWSSYEQAAQAALCSIDPSWCTASFDAIRAQIQSDCTIFVPGSGQQINPIRYAAQCVSGVWTGTCVAPVGIECQEGCSAPSPAPTPTCGGSGSTCVANQDCCGNIPCVQDTCLAAICQFDDCNYVAQVSGGYVVVVHGAYVNPPSGSGSGNTWTSLTAAQNAWNTAKGCGHHQVPPCTMDNCNYVGQVSGGYVVVINGAYLNPPSGSGSGNVWTSVTAAQTAFTDTAGCGGTVSTCMPESGVCTGTSDCCPGLDCQGGRCIQSVQCKPAGSACQAASECCDLACVQGVCTTPPTTGCGTEGSPCCTTGTACTQADTICQSGFCVACGEVNTPCCANNTCNTTDLACINGYCNHPTTGGGGCSSTSPCGSGYVCVNSQCVPCGSGSEPCCPGNLCEPGYLCYGGQCVPCGGQNNPCCADNVCDTTYICNAGTCQPCGYVGETCCPGSLCITAGTTCVSGVCTQPAMPCGNTGAQCTEDSACCSGYGCYGGQCAPNTIQCGTGGAGCTADGDCCGGYSCVSGQCTPTSIPPPPSSSGTSAIPIVLGILAAVGAGAIAVAAGQGDKK